MTQKITYIDEVDVQHKRVLLRVDFNVTLTNDFTIADDARIRAAIPTIKHLLEDKNKLIIIAHLGRPESRVKKYSLASVAEKVQEYFPKNKVSLVSDFLHDKSIFDQQTEGEILVLENIRFFSEEKKNDQHFARKLADLGDIFVQDAFGVCHRTDATVVGLPHFLPSYGGLLLKKEVDKISRVIKHPEKPFVAIIGGAKISSKIHFLDKLMGLADYLLVGGAIANTFFAAEKQEIGQSTFDYDELEHVKKLLLLADKKNTRILLPTDVIVGNPKNTKRPGEIKKVSEVSSNSHILDIGPATEALFGSVIGQAKTIVWTGPMGFVENPVYRRGTEFVYYAVTENEDSFSVVGGGDTLSAISKEEYLDKIDHISTGGGAMLEFIEKGTLPGLETLRY